jgi:zinc transport system ATP-binding protein
VTAVLQARAASIGYGDLPVVREVSLRVDPGEVLAVLGANGSGKTTLLRGVLGLAPVLSGEVLLFGQPASTLRERARIGYVPQRLSVGGGIPGTVREVVASGRLARSGWLGRTGPADRAAVERAIAAVNLTERSGTALTALSGGQQRRALIARALAAEPDLLLMDEPVAGVDQASQRTLAGTISSLVRLGVTLVVVTHEAGPLLPVITRAVVMEAGRVGYDGPLLPSMLGVSDGLPPAVTP